MGEPARKRSKAGKGAKAGAKELVAPAWGERRAPSRGPKPGFSTIEIARAAILIADREGFEAVTMQRVAREIGATTMALYRYFPSKDDLVAVMIDSVGVATPSFSKTVKWKDRLREWAGACAGIYREHGWFLEATTVRRSAMGPNELSWMEAALAILADAGLSPEESWFAFLSIIGHIRGHATFEQARGHGGARPDWIPELTQLMRAEGERYPATRAALGSGAFSSNGGEAFDYGLNCILNGIRAPKRA
jgi:AcrR family transcriptional regulator